MDDIRAREAAHTRELAEQRHVLRLWRPPLQPGEWRTLGLFAAADDGQLEDVLQSMPLPGVAAPMRSRRWRRTRTTRRLGPGSRGRPPGTGTGVPGHVPTESVPPGTPAQAVHGHRGAGGGAGPGTGRPGTSGAVCGRCRSGARAGPVARPGRGRDAGHPGRRCRWHAWMTEQTTPLSPHPSDPGLAGR